MGKYIDEYYQIHSLPKECPVCGKKFIPAPEHYWKIGSHGGMDTRDTTVCSYSCMRKWEKEQEAKEEQKHTRNKYSDYSREAISLIKSRMPDEISEQFVELRYGGQYSTQRIANMLGYQKRQMERYASKISKLIEAMDDIKDGHIIHRS